MHRIPPCNRSSRETARAFTLVEVLVVVGVIAILVAMLIPVLRQARSIAQAAKCAANMKQGVSGAITHLLETGMRKERWSTNFGWATQALRLNRQESEIFNCPTDLNAIPTPAILDRQYDTSGKARGEVSADAIFNRVVRVSGNTYQADIQDQVDRSNFGGDAYSDPSGDCLINYTVTGRDQKTAQATAQKGVASWRHDLFTYRGSPLWTNVSGTTQKATVPIMWMSFGANADAGLLTTRGPVILVAESAKLGLFPEPLDGYPADNLARAMRFRHGPRVVSRGMVGADYVNRPLGSPPPALGPLSAGQLDSSYEPRTRANCGFMDGHVSLMSSLELFTLDQKNPDTVYPRPKGQLWIGMRPASNVSKSF